MLRTVSFAEQEARWPIAGRHILAQFDQDGVWVYQAYPPEIADWVLEHGQFGGPWRFDRMSWIKTSFLWMMHRSGWGTAEGQERVLAVKLKRAAFDAILNQAVHSSYDEAVYETKRSWRLAVRYSMVRVQWDPDRAPDGTKVARRAIQLGLCSDSLRRYASEWLLEIVDMTDLVRAQAANAHPSRYEELETPFEEVYPVSDPEVAAKLGVKSP